MQTVIHLGQRPEESVFLVGSHMKQILCSLLNTYGEANIYQSLQIQENLFNCYIIFKILFLLTQPWSHGILGWEESENFPQKKAKFFEKGALASFLISLLAGS